VLGMAAVRADVHRHVLDDAEDRDADLLEHLEALARVDERDVLRRGDDDAPVTGTFCASVSWMSPVPGGRSTTR
jgi:hypothetical protein